MGTSSFELKDADYTETEKRGIIQPQLMALCRNNPYVNSILIDNEAKLVQQHMWHEKRVKYVKRQIKEIIKKIKQIVEKNRFDRRLKGLYSRLSSIQNKLLRIKLTPVVFGTKRLFLERILGKINKDEFRIRRDSSFCCVGKKQGVNLNVKVFSDRTLKIRTFSKEKGKKWFIIPFTSIPHKKDGLHNSIKLSDNDYINRIYSLIKTRLNFFVKLVICGKNSFLLITND